MHTFMHIMQVGACIVNPESKKVVATGHNALPESRGWDQKDFPHWEKRDLEKYNFEDTKYAHGEYIPCEKHYIH